MRQGRSVDSGLAFEVCAAVRVAEGSEGSDICKDIECLNGSNCTVDSSDPSYLKPRCDCLYGFDGIKCEQDLCSQIECYNGGTCTINENDSKILEPGCNCTNQFVGDKPLNTRYFP